MAQNEVPVKVTVGLVDKLSGKIEGVKQKLAGLAEPVKRMKNNFDFLQESTATYRETVDKFAKAVVPTMEKVGKGLTVGITLPVIAGAGYSIKKFVDFENALNEVQGSTDLTGESLKKFGQDMIKVSTETTFSQEELLQLAAAAGETGVRGSENLAKFSLTLAQLGKTANLAGPDTAEALFKILTLTKTGVGFVGNLGSSITELENKYGVKASKILDSTEAITREVAKFGLSSTQIAGLATAIAPMGFEAKNASAAVGEAFRGIDNAIREGGIKMQGLQKITGLTGEELKRQFKDNPEVVFEAFLKGLNTIDKAGGQSAEALAFFGASGDKTGIILTSLAGDIDKLREVQTTAAKAFADNTALTDEYKDTTTTLASSMKMFKNNTDALAVTLGNRLAPAVKWAADMVGGLMKWFSEHPTIATFVAVLAGLAATLGPLILGAAALIKAWGEIMVFINLMKVAWAGLNLVQYAALLPYILIGAAIIALIAIIWIFRDAIVKGLVTAWDWVVEKVLYVWELLKKFMVFAKDAFLDFTPLGLLIKGGMKLAEAMSGPDGKETGAAGNVASANVEFQTQTNNSRVDINVRAPKETSIQGGSDGGNFNINRGPAGVW